MVGNKFPEVAKVKTSDPKEALNHHELANALSKKTG